jgi:Na+/proline symporter
MFLLQTVIYIGIVIYAPALALETVTGLDRFAAIWITGAVCIFYTTIGGLKVSKFPFYITSAQFN